MSHAIPVFIAIALCLTAAGVVTWTLAPMFLKPRARVVADLASPEGQPLIPASGAAPATRADLPIPPARNGVYRGRQPRQTIHVIICDPAVTPVVPRYYRAWLEGRWSE